MAGTFVGLPGSAEGSELPSAMSALMTPGPTVPGHVLEVHDAVVADSLETVAASVAEAGDLRQAMRVAASALNAAGIESPRADAELLAGHLLGEDRGRVAVLALMGAPVPEGYGELVARRAARLPLQHLTGTAPFRRLELAVGPGVFVPRPETELVAQAAIDEASALLSSGQGALVVDLCTGSGAIAAAVASEAAGATVHAVELSERAHAYAARNLSGTGVALHLGDAVTLLEELGASVDVLVSNPPYVPNPQVPVDPEVSLHDPELALYGGGADGMDFPLALIARAEFLLKPGGLLVMEHDESQGPAMLAALGHVEPAAPAAGEPARTSWTDAVVHQDLNGRDRFTTARLARPDTFTVGE